MGAYKGLHYRWTALGWRPGKGEAEHMGIGPLGAPLASREDRDEARESAAEARAERAAVQAVEREADAERRRAEEAARPKVFAPDPPDFPRTARIAPDRSADPEVAPEHVGLAVEWPRTARIAAADRRRLADVLDGRIPPQLARLRAELGPPEPPAVHTGWYRCGDGFDRVGSGPYPEYRPPGLRWKLHWLIPKPDDVPWEGAPAPSAADREYIAAKVGEYQSALLLKDRRVRDPTGAREPAGKLDQLRFGW